MKFSAAILLSNIKLISLNVFPKKAPLPKINIKGNNFNNNVFIFFNIVDIVHSPTGRTCFCVSQEARGSLPFFTFYIFSSIFNN